MNSPLITNKTTMNVRRFFLISCLLSVIILVIKWSILGLTFLDCFKSSKPSFASTDERPQLFSILDFSLIIENPDTNKVFKSIGNEN